MHIEEIAPHITRLRFENSLQALLHEIHTAPLVSHWLWYRVGSRNEHPGITGASHWVEHMQFKGTPRFPGGATDRAIARLGGHWNAMTYQDWTTYYETLPADQALLALDIEADRMAGSLFTPEDVESERTVIISERQGSENEPSFRLSEEVRAAAFRVHSYHHEVIGDMADLIAMQRDDLYAHYRRYYCPANAVLALAGDFDTAAMIDEIRRRYEAMPGQAAPLFIPRPEPDQPGERRVLVEGNEATTYVEAAYHTPHATHPDFPAMQALDSLLSGPSNLSMFGDGLSNKTCRIYRALVEKEWVVNISGGMNVTIDPFLYTFHAIVRPDKRPEQVLSALDDEIKRIQDTPPSADELARALKQARALHAYGSERITNQAFWLGFSEMFDRYEWYLQVLERLEAVTPDEVQRAAQTYFRPQNRVVGVYSPSAAGRPTTFEEDAA